MEAMASGCPIVASKVGGIGELIEDGTSGLLVEQADPMALASALQRVLRDEVLGARLTRGGLARVASVYAQDRIAARYGSVLMEVAE
jgi:glycosyltransferase involved in cell wall biosynthesis